MEQILIIEDDDILAEGVKMNLALAGFGCRTAGTLARVRACSGKNHVIC